LASYVKSFKEDWTDIRVILTGSSMNRFFSKDIRIPVGRTRSLCVYSFNYSEFLRFTGDEELADFINEAPKKIPATRHKLLLEKFDNYLLIGGYPETVKAYASGNSHTEIIDEIVANLEEDFARKEAYQPKLFDNILKAVANHIGSISKYSHIDSTKYKAKLAIEDYLIRHPISNEI
jgi:predicted AAA+ superfamily ATPase